MIHSEHIRSQTQQHIETIGFHPAAFRGLHAWCNAHCFKEYDLIEASWVAHRNRHQEAEILGINRDVGGTQFTVFKLQIMSNPDVEACYMVKDDRVIILGYQLAGCSEANNEDRIGLCRRGPEGEPVFASLVEDCLTYDLSGHPELTRAMKRQLFEKLLHKTKNAYTAEGLMSDYYLGIDKSHGELYTREEDYLRVEHHGNIHIFATCEWHP